MQNLTLKVYFSTLSPYVSFLFHSCFFQSYFFLSSLLSLVCTLLLPPFALGMCSRAVSSCQTLFCYTLLAPSFTDTSHFHIYAFSPAFLHVHPSLCFFYSRSISFTRLLPFSSQGYLGFPSLFTSLPLLSLFLFSSLSYSTYLSFTFTHCQHFPLLPPPLPALISLLSFSQTVCISSPCS